MLSPAIRRLFLSAVALSTLVTVAHASALPSYTAVDLGTVPPHIRVPEIPYLPRFDGAGGVTVYSAGYYSGPQISSPDPRFETIDPTAAISTYKSGLYVTGWVSNQHGSAAFLSNGSSAQTIGPIVGPVGSSGSSDYAYGVNSRGQVVGSTLVNGGRGEAFLYAAGQNPLLLGTLGGASSGASAINDADQIVGTSDTSGGVSHAFLFAGGTMTDLNLLIPPSTGWLLTSGTDIDNAGQILVEAANASGANHLFRLDPTPAPVPEPATLGIWLLGGTLSLWRMRRAVRKTAGIV